MSLKKPKRKLKSERFAVRFAPPEKAALMNYAAAEDMNAGQVIRKAVRELVRAAAKGDLQREPRND